MFASLFITAFMATVFAQAPLTTVTLPASAILPPQASSTVLPTVTNAPVTTITLSSGAIIPASPVQSSEPTIVITSTITSSICGACTPSAVGGVVVAAVPTTIRTTISTVSRNATVTGGSNIFPVNRGNVSANGTVIFANAGEMLSAGSLAISAGVLAASFFAFAL